MNEADDSRSCGRVTAVAVHPTLGNGGLVFVETDTHRSTARLVGTAAPSVGEWLTRLPLGKVGVSDSNASDHHLLLEIVSTTVTSDAERAQRLRGKRKGAAKPEIQAMLGFKIAALAAVASACILSDGFDLLVSLACAATDPSVPEVLLLLLCILGWVLDLGFLSFGLLAGFDGARRYRQLNFDFWIGLQRKEKSDGHCSQKSD